MKSLNIFLIMMCLFLIGCGKSEIPEYSEEQTEEITEYAAGLMLKYDSKYSSKLLTKDELAKMTAEEKEDREKEKAYKEAAAKYANKKEAESDNASGSNSSGASEPVEKPLNNIAEFYGIEGVMATYTGYELTASYPSSGEDMLMAMEATPGHQLLILKFDVSNTLGDSVNFDMFYRKPKFSLSIDGDSGIYNQSTLLLDDMAAYVGELPGNSTVPMVLIFEVGDDIAGVGSLTLSARNDTEKASIAL